MSDQIRINGNHLTHRYRRKYFLKAAVPLLLAMGEPPLVCRRPRSKDTGLWKRTNVETDIHLKCANVLCGWCSNIRVTLVAPRQTQLINQN